MWPNRFFLRAYVLRGAMLWLGARLIIGAVLLVSRRQVFELSGPASLEVILISVVLCFVESFRRRERALLANQGISYVILFWVCLFPAAAGELAVHTAMRLIR
jgi:hypothetical protein